MPQLDRAIVFTQVLWLFIIFFISYALLTHFLLPSFLKSLKSRNSITKSNALEAKTIYQSFSNNQITLNQLVHDGLVMIKFLYAKDSLPNKKYNNLIDFDSLDNKLVSKITSMTLHCDNIVLNSVSLKSKIYSLNHQKCIY